MVFIFIFFLGSCLVRILVRVFVCLIFFIFCNFCKVVNGGCSCLFEVLELNDCVLCCMGRVNVKFNEFEFEEDF